MNAFQIGIRTYKWNETKACYVSRPFNAYVWPHSDILGDRVNQFKSSNLKFLMQHNFDFNKLFKEGVNYQRLSDEPLVKKKIDLRSEEDIIRSTGGITSNQGIRYNTQRAYTSIGSTSQTSLEDYVRKVANFAILAQSREDWPIMEIRIESYALRRKLS